MLDRVRVAVYAQRALLPLARVDVDVPDRPAAGPERAGDLADRGDVSGQPADRVGAVRRGAAQEACRHPGHVGGRDQRHHGIAWPEWQREFPLPRSHQDSQVLKEHRGPQVNRAHPGAVEDLLGQPVLAHVRRGSVRSRGEL
jgi:hypothetical protein